MVLTKDGKALTANGKLLKGNSGLIKVDELPENPQENVIYQVNEISDIDVYFKEDNAVPTSLYDVIWGMFDATPSMFYYVVSEFPSTPNVSDLQTFSTIHVYINNDIPYIYGNVGYGNMWLDVATITENITGIAYDNKGYINDPYFIKYRGVYVTYKKQKIGIYSEYGAISVFKDGKYMDYESIFYKTITKLDSNIVIIPSCSFEDCTKLTEVKLPKVENIYWYAFSECYNLTSVDLRGEDRRIYLDSGAFSLCHSLLNVYINSTQIVNMVDTSTFEGCYNLTVHVRPELVEQYENATNWSILIANGDITIVGDVYD